MRPNIRRLTAGSAAAALAIVGFASPAMASHEDETGPSGAAGDERIVVPITDSEAGGTYFQPFVKVYDRDTPDGTPVFVYVPEGALDNPDPTGVHSLDPQWDPTPGDEYNTCADAQASDFAITSAQVKYLGDQLSQQIVRVDEEHYGPIGLADPADPDSKSLVTLVYNVQDEAYYDCEQDSYTAGYFAPE